MPRIFDISLNDRELDLSSLSGRVVSGDHNADTIRIHMNRYYGDTDMSKYGFVVIGRNSVGQPISRPVVKTLATEDATEMTFDWLVDDQFTDVSGTLEIWFGTKGGDFSWNTLPTQFQVEEGLNIAEMSDIGEQYLEVFQTLVAQTETYKNNAIQASTSAKENADKIINSTNTSTEAAGYASTSKVAAALSEKNAKISEVNAKASENIVQAIKDSTEMFYNFDNDPVTGYRLGLRRADETEFSYTGNLQATVNVGTVTNAIDAKVGMRGTPQNRVLDFTLPKGDTGAQGLQGVRGEVGVTPNFTVGSVSASFSGSEAEITISGTPENPVFNMILPRGNQGAKGDKGDKGDRSTIKIGAITSLLPEQTPYVVNMGNATDAVFNIGIPKGMPGNQGDKGDKGDGINVAGMRPSFSQLVADFPKGDGTNSYFLPDSVNSSLPPDLYVWTGNQWKNIGKLTGIDGKDGENGLSAYQLVVENGFEGTVSEWLVSLQGEQGPQGNRGFPATVNGISPDSMSGEMTLTPADIGLSKIKNIDYAPLISPALTGTPTAPEPPQNNSSGQIATTKFVGVSVESGVGTLRDDMTEVQDTLEKFSTEIDGTKLQIEQTKMSLNTHAANIDNPHGITASKISAAIGDTDGNAVNSFKLGGLLPEVYIQPQPNLIINSDFAINQRGQDIYTINNAFGFTFDRWGLVSTGSIARENTYVKLTFSGFSDRWAYLVHRYERSECLRNKPITYSMSCRASLDSNCSLYVYDHAIVSAFTEVNIPPDNQWRVVTCTGVVPDVAHTDGQVEFSINGCFGTLEIAWVKAEIGSRFTGWYPPMPGAELAECQRYYQVHSRGDIPVADLCPTMRVNPTVTNLGAGRFSYNAEH